MTLPRPDATSVVVLIVFVIAIFAATPVGRATVIEAGVTIERLLGIGPWPAYYGVLQRTPAGDIEHLMFWDGSGPGRSVFSAPGSGWTGAWWAPDRSLLAFAASADRPEGGTDVYLADRSGIVTKVADLTPLRVMTLNWIGSERLAVLARSADNETDWLVDVHVRTGQVSRRQLPEIARPARQAGLLGVLDAGATPPARKVSQDGRWLITGDRPCRSVAVYDLVRDRRIELADGVQTRGYSIGWLRGSVLVWGLCDEATGTLRLRAGAPDAAPTELGSLPLAAINDALGGPILDEARDRILFQAKAGDEWVFTSIDLTGAQEEVARLRIKIESELGWVLPLAISRDGHLLGFTMAEQKNIGYAGTLVPVLRAGVVDLRTGAITWACDVDCGYVRLR